MLWRGRSRTPQARVANRKRDTMFKRLRLILEMIRFFWPA
jgi:hypothetical protein